MGGTGLADGDLDPVVVGEGIAGQRDERAAFPLEGLVHGDRAVFGPGAVGGDAVAPGQGLGVEIVDIAPPAGGEEAGPDIANRPLHAPLLVAARDRDGLGQEVVVAGEVEDPGIEPDGGAAAPRASMSGSRRPTRREGVRANASRPGRRGGGIPVRHAVIDSDEAQERYSEGARRRMGREQTGAGDHGGRGDIGDGNDRRTHGSESFDALIETPWETFEEQVVAAMAEGLALERPPAAGPIDVALACGVWESRPRVMTTGDWLSELDPNDEIAALPSPVREELVGDGAAWPDDYVVVKGCSEGAAILQEAMEEADDGHRVKAGFFARLESRHEDCALRMLRSAQVLKGAGNFDWKIFAGPQRPCWTAERWRRSRSWSMSGRGRTGSWQTRNCYQGVSERTDGMLEKKETARAAFSGHRAKAAGWPTISTDGARCRLDMEADRLLCDDGRMLPWRPTARKIQRERRVEGWTTTGQDARSHMRQEDRGGERN